MQTVKSMDFHAIQYNITCKCLAFPFLFGCPYRQQTHCSKACRYSSRNLSGSRSIFFFNTFIKNNSRVPLDFVHQLRLRIEMKCNLHYFTQLLCMLICYIQSFYVYLFALLQWLQKFYKLLNHTQILLLGKDSGNETDL